MVILKLLGSILHCSFTGFRGPLNWVAMMQRGTSFLDCYTQGRTSDHRRNFSTNYYYFFTYLGSYFHFFYRRHQKLFNSFCNGIVFNSFAIHSRSRFIINKRTNIEEFISIYFSDHRFGKIKFSFPVKTIVLHFIILRIVALYILTICKVHEIPHNLA